MTTEAIGVKDDRLLPLKCALQAAVRYVFAGELADGGQVGCDLHQFGEGIYIVDYSGSVPITIQRELAIAAIAKKSLGPDEIIKVSQTFVGENHADAQISD